MRVLRSAESRLAALALWSIPLVAALAVVEDAVMVGATFETETEIYETVTEIYETVTVTVIFATLAMVPHFGVTWTVIGVVASEISTLGSRHGWASVEGARARPRATFGI